MVESIRQSPRGSARQDEAATAHVAVAVVFLANGVLFASWLARVPALRDAFGLTGAQLGLLLLCLSAGAVAALPSAGPLVHRLGPSRSVVVGATAVVVGLLAVAAAIEADAVVLCGVGLLLVGTGTGTWDVAMNVEGAEVERRVGRPIMPRLHGWFSVGTVIGAGVGAASAWADVPLTVQLLVLAPLTFGVVVVATRRFLPVTREQEEHRQGSSGVGRAWREPRTLLVGLMTLGFAFTEGSANDWLAVTLVDGFGASEAVGAIGFGVFVSAMTLGRLFGGAALERWGRVRVLRGSALVSLVGLVLVLVGGPLAVAIAGAALWGLGAALGFPAGMTTAADDPAMAAARVSVVSSIAYTAFLAGPPLIGPLSDAVGFPAALVVVVAALVLSLVTAGAARRDTRSG